MSRSLVMVLLFVAWLPALPPVVQADPDTNDTRLLSQPAVSSRNVAFVYADDLWVADVDGKNVRRLTTDVGVESNPAFSPDGRWIAFSAQYDGNTDVFVISVSGGSPRRLTSHPDADIVRGFSPDGKRVLFSSGRHVFTGRYTQLYIVPVSGGMPEQLPAPHGVEACFAPDSNALAYTPLADRTQQWKHYRGGTHSRIWIQRLKNDEVEEIPQPAGSCNDLDPHWIGGTIYFRSDRDGEYNVYAYDTARKTVTQCTNHTDFPAVDLASGGNRLIYEQAGYLHLFDPVKRMSSRLKIGVASDLTALRPRFVKGAKYVRSAGISPSGARTVFGFRGEIVTVPAEKGDARNLTESPGAHDHSPAWSPDGKSIAYFSDEQGEYRLFVRSHNGKGQARVFDPRGAGHYRDPVWSPDSKKIAYADNSQSIFWIELASGSVKRIASEPIYGPTTAIKPAWSPDSKWVAYALGNRAGYHQLFAYELVGGKSRPITDGLSDATDPVFDASGQYLFFFASTDAGPVNQWFAQSNADMRAERQIYLAVLKQGEPSPLKRESDEEQPAEQPAKTSEEKSEKKADGKGEGATREPPPVVIDFERIDQRIVALPEPAADYVSLQAGQEGRIYYLERSDTATDATEGGGDARRRSMKLQRFDLEKRKSETVLTGVSAFQLAGDGKKALVALPSDSWSIIDLTGAPPTADKGKLKIETVEIRIDPRKEWPQIFEDAWRINRDYFYDPGMHGADWPAIKRKYAAFLPHLATRGDLDRVIRWMLSELAVGHSNLSPGERFEERSTVPGGLLGADYEVADGRYRFKKIYGGLNWSRELRAPLTAPGVDVKAGEYLLAVRGIDLKPPTEVFSLFENTAGKSIEITVGPKPDGSGSRSVAVEPMASEYALRNRDWVEGNLKKVHEATHGQVAYVYVPNTATSGHEYFKRYFYPQCDKPAIIVDERFNGGGQVADYYIDHLRRPFGAMWTTRYGQDFKTPGAAIHGPKVMIIDETAGSGGDLLPWMFREFKLGPLIGKRTWGGLVGILGTPTLMDGGRVTAPNLAAWTKDGWLIENLGVAPDIEVEQWPVAVNAGKDPQLEKAIEVVLEQLKKHPPASLQRPPFPIRVRK